MPRPKNEDLIRLEDVQALILKLTGITRCRATIYNYIRNGRKGYTGENVKLKSARRMGVFFTTEAWVKEFIEKIG